MQPAEILAWLQQNTGFFDEFAPELAQMQTPYNGNTISLTTKQLARLRDQNCLLTQRLHEQQDCAKHNDCIAQHLHRLTLALMQTRTVGNVLDVFRQQLETQFAIQHTAIRLWADDHTVSESLKKWVKTLRGPYCSDQVKKEIQSWFQPATPTSFALFPLRDCHATFGIGVLAANDARHYFSPDAGTVYLERLADLVASAIIRVSTV